MYLLIVKAYQNWILHNDLRLQRIAERVIGIRFVRYWKRELRKRGPSLAFRLKGSIKNNLTLISFMTKDNMELRAQRVLTGYVRKCGQFIGFRD